MSSPYVVRRLQLIALAAGVLSLGFALLPGGIEITERDYTTHESSAGGWRYAIYLFATLAPGIFTHIRPRRWRWWAIAMSALGAGLSVLDGSSYVAYPIEGTWPNWPAVGMGLFLVVMLATIIFRLPAAARRPRAEGKP